MTPGISVASAIFVLGTRHVYQFGAGTSLGQHSCSDEHEALFRDRMLTVCRFHHIRAIGEEMSIDALRGKNRTESTPKTLADALAIPHSYCDPIFAEWETLGIIEENVIVWKGCRSGLSKREIRNQIHTMRRKREPYWLSKLEVLNTWPTLFICGFWHVPSFCKLVEDKGHSTTVVDRSWHA